MSRNTNQAAEVIDFCACSISSFLLCHTIFVYAQSLSYVYILRQSCRSIKLHYCRQQHSASYTMRNIVESTQRMSHTMVYTQTNIRECHTCNILSHSHTITTYRVCRFVNCNRQIFMNHLDSLDFKHIAKFPSTLGDESFDSMSHGIHTCRGGKTLR